MKDKMFKFLIEYPVFLLYIFSWIILSTLITLGFYNFIPLRSTYLMLTIFIHAINCFIMTVMYQFLLQERLVEMNYRLSYKIYKRFKISEKESQKKLEKLNEERKISSLKIDINKKQNSEISSIRGIIIKRLEDE